MNIEEKTPYQKEREDYHRRLTRLDQVRAEISTYNVEWFGDKSQLEALQKEEERLMAYFQNYSSKDEQTQAEEELDNER